MKAKLILSFLLASTCSLSAGLYDHYLTKTTNATYSLWNFDTPAMNQNPASIAPDIFLSDFVNTSGINPEISFSTNGSAGKLPVYNPEEGRWDNDGSFNLVSTNITIPNNPEPNPYKDIILEVVFEKTAGGTFTVNATGRNANGEAINEGTLVDLTIIPDDNKAIYQFRLEPNPAYETLCLAFSQGSIDSIEVYTQCVPEPATMAMLAAGALGLAKRRK